MALKGIKQTPEHIAKRTASALKTKENWTEEKRRIAMKNLSDAHIGHENSEESKERCSKSMIGKQNSLGTKRSLKFREHLSEYWKDNPNHNFRIDGNGKKRNGKRQAEMGRLKYRLWREAVFERDGYTCQSCNAVGGELQADHIRPYSLFPEIRLAVSNGRTLCKGCHELTDTYSWKLAHKIRKCGGHDACRENWSVK